MANNNQKLELTWVGKDNPEYNITNKNDMDNLMKEIKLNYIIFR